MIVVPTVVRTTALANGHDEWLASLPDLVAELAAAWALEIGAPYEGGTESLVVSVTTDDGTPAVLKIAVPGDDGWFDHELTALELAGGHGLVLTLRTDRSRAAALLERLGPTLSSLGLPIAERHRVLVEAARRVWRPAAGAGLPTGAWKACWLSTTIDRWWTELDRPCDERTVASAHAAAERRAEAHDEERAVLVHGDVHQWNALRTVDGEGFTLIDPDGLLAEPEYDLGIVMREDPIELVHGDPHDRSRRLAAMTGLDEAAIWDWGEVERVSTGLLCLRDGMQTDGWAMLRVADAVAAR